MRELGTWMPSDLGSHNRSAHWSRMTSFWTEPASFRANQSQAIVFPSVAPQSLRFVFNDSSACCVVFDEFQFRFFSFHFACSAWLDIAFLILHVSRTISPFFLGGGGPRKRASLLFRALLTFPFCSPSACGGRHGLVLLLNDPVVVGVQKTRSQPVFIPLFFGGVGSC